jgi:hypothetical protein
LNEVVVLFNPMTLLLLSGRPGAGKTEVGKWLAEHCGFTHIETDTDAGWETLRELLGGFQSPQDAAVVRDKARALGEKVVIEWGFRVNLLGYVRLLRDAGFDAWWLDGDEEAARHGYMELRGDSPNVMDAYWAQTNAIETAWPKLESFYGDHVVRTVTSGPTYRPLAEIVSIMLPD